MSSRIPLNPETNDSGGVARGREDERCAPPGRIEAAAKLILQIKENDLVFSTYFKLLSKIKGISKNNCDFFLKVHNFCYEWPL